MEFVFLQYLSDQLEFYVGLADLKVILAASWTLAGFWTLFLDTEWWIFIGKPTLEFYNF